MKPTNTTNTVLIVAGALVAMAFAYWFFFTGTGNEAPVSPVTTPLNPAQMQFETLVGELQPISFNTSIFSDARFNALVDINTPIAPESFGRLDPLAPIAGGGGI